jgi:hypothetical protein
VGELYVIVGSSGGALIGLQFVAITLLADRQRNSSKKFLQIVSRGHKA